MSETGFIRARNEEQKNLRLDQIIDAAVELYDDTPYDRITLAGIAEKLSFSRANLYKYVNSKEDIYLLVISRELGYLVNDLVEAFEDESDIPIGDFADRWSQILYRHERLLRLFSVLFTLIEKNVSADSLAAFKKLMYGHLAELTPLFVRLLPSLPQEAILPFLNMQIHYVAGLYPSTIQGDIQREALRKAGIDEEVQGFVPAFTYFVKVVYRGLTADTL